MGGERGKAEVIGFGEAVCRWWVVAGSEQTVGGLERQWAKGLCFSITGTRPHSSEMSVGFCLYEQCETFRHSMGSVGCLSSRPVSCCYPFLVSSFFSSGGVKER